jgi:hypothetical protein
VFSETVGFGLTDMVEVVAVPVPPKVSVAVTVNAQFAVVEEGVYVNGALLAEVNPGHESPFTTAHE